MTRSTNRSANPSTHQLNRGLSDTCGALSSLERHQPVNSREASGRHSHPELHTRSAKSPRCLYVFVWYNCNNYSPSIIAFFRACRGRIWTKIGGNESNAFPDIPIHPRTLDFDQKIHKIMKKKPRRKNQKKIQIADYCPIIISPVCFHFP